MLNYAKIQNPKARKKKKRPSSRAICRLRGCEEMLLMSTLYVCRDWFLYQEARNMRVGRECEEMNA